VPCPPSARSCPGPPKLLASARARARGSPGNNARARARARARRGKNCTSDLQGATNHFRGSWRKKLPDELCAHRRGGSGSWRGEHLLLPLVGVVRRHSAKHYQGIGVPTLAPLAAPLPLSRRARTSPSNERPARPTSSSLRSPVVRTRGGNREFTIVFLLLPSSYHSSRRQHPSGRAHCRRRPAGPDGGRIKNFSRDYDFSRFQWSDTCRGGGRREGGAGRVRSRRRTFKKPGIAEVLCVFEAAYGPPTT